MINASQIILVTGGARSGKSALAERLTGRFGQPCTYIATAEPRDAEMQHRILQHQRGRPETWRTVEEPVDLAGALDASDGSGVRLVDCLTLWLSNIGPQSDFRPLTDALIRQRSPVVLVTNEVGQGIVPADAQVRAFRDRQGWLNQAVAEIADEVWLSVCGQPIRIKPAAGWPDDSI